MEQNRLFKRNDKKTNHRLGEVFVAHLSDNELRARIYFKTLQLNNNNTENLLFNEQKT